MSRESAERKERRREQDRRYQKKRYEKIKREKIPNRERPFIFWDGEGPKDAGYALFGNSAGEEICHPFLGTAECLDLLLSSGRANPNAIHIAFGFNYDASMILADLPWRNLKALHVYGATIWKDYEIEHIPHKWFKVRKDGISVQVFDIRSFFAGSYVAALLSLGIGGRDIAAITADKARRSEFVWRDIQSIRKYWKLELKYGPILAEKLRALFLDAGFDLRSWHGPGALARLAMAKHHVFDAMASTPVEVQLAARYAFAGGRFEMPRGGHIEGKIYNADLRSAYPAYARELPNLARGQWRRGREYEPGKFAIYRIHYNSPNRDPLYVHPLFRRQRNGVVDWPSRAGGWFHAPEAELVADDPHAEFLEAWIFDEEDETDRPFAWIADYFDIRAKLKRMGNPLELTFKLIINSIYGQLAQRTGWDRKKRTAPRSHQLEWAGYITSACRAAVYKAAKACGDKLISIDTDGIYSMAPIDVVPGPRLGDWETEEFDEGIFWQSGIYALRRDMGYDASLGYGWIKGKTRGIPKGRYSPETLLRAVLHAEPLQLSVRVFVGYGLALGERFAELNTWKDEDRTIIFGGQAKRYHNEKFYCAKHCPKPVHHFIPPPQIGTDYHSRPHFLPWLKNDPFITGRKNLVADYVAYDANDYDEDGELEWCF